MTYPPQPGLGVTPPPAGWRPKRTGLIAGLVAGAVAVTAILVTGLAAPGWMVGGSGDPDSVAASFAQAYQDADDEQMIDLMCARPDDDAWAAVLRELGGDQGLTGFTVEVDGTVEVTGGTATARMAGSGARNGKPRTVRGEFGLRRSDGDWCVTGARR